MNHSYARRILAALTVLSLGGVLIHFYVSGLRLQLYLDQVRGESPMVLFPDPDAGLRERNAIINACRTSVCVDRLQWVTPRESLEIARRNPLLKPVLPWVGAEIAPPFFMIYLTPSGFMERGELESVVRALPKVWMYRFPLPRWDHYRAAAGALTDLRTAHYGVLFFLTSLALLACFRPVKRSVLYGAVSVLAALGGLSAALYDAGWILAHPMLFAALYTLGVFSLCPLVFYLLIEEEARAA